MRPLLLPSLILASALLQEPASAQAPPTDANEVAAAVGLWGKGERTRSSTISTWIQTIQGEDYAAFQIRADLDIYQFVLNREQLLRFIDALKNYQAAYRQASRDQGDAVGWLYRTEVKLKRLGDEAKDDRLLLNVERRRGQRPSFALTFDSWLLSFGGPDGPAGRTYKGVSIQHKQVLTLQENLKEMLPSLPQ